MLPWYFWNFSCNSAFLRWQTSINVQKMDCSLSFLCVQDNFLSSLSTGHLQSGHFFKLFPLFVHSGFGIRDNHCLKHRCELVHKIANDSMDWTPSQQCDHHNVSASFPMRFLVDSCASTMHACFDFWILLDPLSISRCWYDLFAVFSSQVLSVRFEWFRWTPYHPDQ